MKYLFILLAAFALESSSPSQEVIIGVCQEWLFDSYVIKNMKGQPVTIFQKKYLGQEIKRSEEGLSIESELDKEFGLTSFDTIHFTEEGWLKYYSSYSKGGAFLHMESWYFENGKLMNYGGSNQFKYHYELYAWSNGRLDSIISSSMPRSNPIPTIERIYFHYLSDGGFTKTLKTFNDEQVMSYSSLGREIRYDGKLRNGDSLILFYDVFQDGSLRIEKTTNNKGVVQDELRIELDINGNPIKETLFLKGVLVSEDFYTYTYDDKGNWVERIWVHYLGKKESSKTGEKSKVVREILYNE